MLLSLKNLWRRKTRTILTAIGIAVGVAAVIVFSAFGQGMARGFGNVSASADADLVVSQEDAVMIIIGSVDEAIGAEIAGMRGVRAVVGTIVGVIQSPDSPYFMVAGEDPRGFAMGHYKVVEGRVLRARREVMLGRQTAANLKKRVGDRFSINEAGYQVVGIYETGVSFEDNGAVIHLADAQRSFDKRRQVSYFKLKLHDIRDVEQVRAAIEKRWDDLAVTRSGEPTKQDEVLGIYNSLGWVLGLFAVVVGGLGMMNALLMSVFERTREIGVLRALGWRRWRIITMILGESLALALVGGLLGIGMGAGLMALASQSPAVAGFLSGALEPGHVIQALVIALTLGLVGGFYPAWRAARLAPVEAMRAEGGASVHWGRITRLLAGIFRGGALRNVLRRPIRSLMTALGLGIGVGFILLLTGIVEGSRQLFTDILAAGQADLIAEQAGASDAMFSAIDERVADRFRFHPEVRSVSQMVIGSVTAPGLPFFILYGLDPREEYIRHYRLREGRLPERPREIIVGRLAANSLEKGLGDTVRLSGASYKIVGIFENGQPYEDTGGVILLREAQRMLNKPRQVSFISIALHDPTRAEAIAAELERTNPEVIVSVAARMTERMQDFATLDAIFAALLLLMMVVGGVVMMNVMVMSVYERTQEIGVLRAVGWSRGRVLRMVLVESLALAILSALAGGAIGVGLGALLQLDQSYGALLQPIYTPAALAQTMLLALALGAVGGLMPAWRAAGLRPVEALRYE